MITIRERIAAQIKSALVAIGGVTVARSPQVDFDQSELPALGLFMGDETTDTGPTSDFDINRMDVLIVGHATGADGEAAETAAHALYGQALAAAVADYTQAGLAVNSRKTGLAVTGNPDPEGAVPLVGFELTVEVEYWTRSADATALAP